MKRFILYLIRWQMSTPILAVCCAEFNYLGVILSTIIANLIGGILFFGVDFYIFVKKDVDKNKKSTRMKKRTPKNKVGK